VSGFAVDHQPGEPVPRRLYRDPRLLDDRRRRACAEADDERQRARLVADDVDHQSLLPAV
jgi:hypothetical protein